MAPPKKFSKKSDSSKAANSGGSSKYGKCYEFESFLDLDENSIA